MKKRIIGSFIVVGLLVGCGDGVVDEGKMKEKNESSAIEKSEEITEENRLEDKKKEDEPKEGEIGWTGENPYGVFTLKKTLDISETYTSGIMELSINGINVFDIEVKDKLKESLGIDKDELVGIAIYMNGENKSEKDVTWFPSQAVMVTNTGEQVDADIWFNEGDLGGTYYGKVVKEGITVYLLEKSKVNDLDWIKLIISEPYNEDSFDSVGKELKIKIDM